MLQLLHKDIKTNKIACGICGTNVIKNSFVRHLKSKKCRSLRQQCLAEIPDLNDNTDMTDDEIVVGKIEANKIDVVLADPPITNKIDDALAAQEHRKVRVEKMFKKIWLEEEEKRRMVKQLQI